MKRFLKWVAARVSLFTFWRSCTKGVITWQEPHAATVVDSSSPWAKDRKATITGTSPTATKSQPRPVEVTAPPRRLRQAKKRSARLRRAKAMPNPRIHSPVVPIQPCGSGTPPVTCASAATDEKRTPSAAARPAAFTPLLAAGVVLQPVALDVLGVLLVLLAEQPLAALVEFIGLEAFLLGHCHRVAVLAVLGRHPRRLCLRQHLGRRPHRSRCEQ